MSPTIALLVTTVIIVVVFHLLDWIFWGMPWAHKKVYAHVPKEIWRLPMDADEATRKSAGRTAMLLGMLTTTFVGVVFVPMVWIFGTRFAGVRSVLLAILLTLVFVLPAAWSNSTYYRIPKQLLWLQSAAGFTRVLVGCVLTTWLLTTFGAW